MGYEQIKLAALVWLGASLLKPVVQATRTNYPKFTLFYITCIAISCIMYY